MMINSKAGSNKKASQTDRVATKLERYEIAVSIIDKCESCKSKFKEAMHK